MSMTKQARARLLNRIQLCLRFGEGEEAYTIARTLVTVDWCGKVGGTCDPGTETFSEKVAWIISKAQIENAKLAPESTDWDAEWETERGGV